MPQPENDESQLSYLKTQIDKQLDRLSHSSDHYRRNARLVQVSTVLISASITVLTGMKLAFVPPSIISKFPGAGTDLVLFLGATSTVIAALGAFYSPIESWHLNTDTYAKIRGLQTKLEFLERAPNFDSHQQAILAQSFAEYQTILADSNRKWDDVRAQSK